MKPFIGTEKRSDTSKAWLLYITKIPERPVQGYEDDLENSYLWDHTTENGRHVAVGDLIVLWDGKQALGISVISHITTSKGKKTTNRCPSCKKALDSPRRKTKKPQYRCRDCEYEFDEPDTETKDVRTSQTEHRAGWVSLAGEIDVKELKSICLRPKSQHSIRQLKHDAFKKLLERNSLWNRFRIPGNVQKVIQGGHKTRPVRIRIGQPKFRKRLLEFYGDNCAISGPAPRAAIHASHLYSYAKTGTHQDEGGLLIRADLHGLFDGGLLKVDAESEKVFLDPFLEQFPQYWGLNGRQLEVSLTTKQKRWMQHHWDQNPFSSSE